MQRITCFISKNKKPILKCHSKIQTALQLHGMMKVTNILKSIHYGPVKSIFTLIKGGLCHIVMMIVNCHFRMFLIEKVKPCSKRPSDLWVTSSTSFWDNMLQFYFTFIISEIIQLHFCQFMHYQDAGFISWILYPWIHNLKWLMPALQL